MDTLLKLVVEMRTPLFLEIFVIFLFIIMSDCLKLMPINKWREISSILKLDFPRSIYGFSFLDSMEDLEKRGFGYNTKVYCPMGDAYNGIVILNLKPQQYEVMIQCPSDNTSILEEALRTTKVIDWTQQVIVPNAPKHVMSCVKRIIKENNCTITELIPGITHLLHKNSPLFDVSLPEDYSFCPLTLKDLQNVNQKLPQKDPELQWTLELLIKAKFGYGLFKGNDLVSWVFIREGGYIGNVYTFDEHRNKGYGKLTVKLISNYFLKNEKHMFFSCVKSNSIALHMYKRLGIKTIFEEEWCTFTRGINK